MIIDALVSENRFALNGVSFATALPASEFQAVLGLPSRIIAAGPPAPFGHRNNQIHLYDELGLYLNEHHYTYTVAAVTLVLWRAEAPFPTECDFTGRLDVGGVVMAPGLAERDALRSTIPFAQSLRGSWTFQQGGLWIGFEAKGRRRPTGRRGSKRFVATLSVCLEHDPWDTRFRPQLTC